MSPAREVLDAELAGRLATLTLRTRKAVEGLTAGMHRSPHRGASVVFVEHRAYRPGDDPRWLDWKAFARNDRHVVKRFEQESRLRATLVLDGSGSMDWSGAPDRVTKHEYAATILGALAYVLVHQADATALVAFDETAHTHLPPRGSADHLDAVLRALARPPRPGSGTRTRAALEWVAERAGRRGLVVVASDLLDFDDKALAPIGHLVSRGHDVLVIHVLDPVELELPFDGPARFVGCEGEAPVDLDPAEVRAAYRAEVARFVADRRHRCLTSGARYVFARTDTPPEHVLAAALGGPTAEGGRGL